MKIRQILFSHFCTPHVIRRFLLSWLIAATTEYILLPQEFKMLQSLAGLAAASLLRVIIIALICFAVFSLLNLPHIERGCIAATYLTFAIVGLVYNFSWPFLIANGVIVGILTVYMLRGWQQGDKNPTENQSNNQRIWKSATAILALIFFAFVSIWTVCRVLSFSTPTFDFGIFSQMFHNMKTTGLPITTVERDGPLSHFNVHISPVYYLLLPFYFIFPYPVTLQILQAAVLASAVIPLWKIGKQHGLPSFLRFLLCVLLLLYPAYSGGASYDIHENAFLTPLILWLFYALDKKNILLAGIFGVLVLCVKEDAAVYVAVIALYYLIRSLLYKDSKMSIVSLCLTALAIIWFLSVTAYLARVGDGVMTYRYANFMYEGSGSLFSVVKSVILNPLKALYECVDTDKLSYIGWTMLPLLALPLFTRRYERYILLIPYILINLMSDYQYQHSLLFQYNFGSLACLFYLTAINLADIRPRMITSLALILCVCISFVGFSREILPISNIYPQKYIDRRSHYENIRDTLDLIPEDASVSATTFYTTYLSNRSVLYDIQYASWEHIISTDYIALDCKYKRPYQDYVIVGDDGFENFCDLLAAEGYTLYAQLDDQMVILRRE